MTINDVIRKKRDGCELTQEEIAFFVRGVAKDSFPDYQVSALLMAIFLKGMTEAETTTLTLEMASSGDTLDLSSIEGKTVDKHSTGGVGDKTTLIVGPIAAALGCKVAKLSGRGLGHTGGTIDKLESIRGFNSTPTSDEFIKQVNQIGICVAGQSGQLAPADKRLYALRDVTCTVDNIPLIASSVMSKKLAASAGNIVLDVKCGSGAFMKNTDDAVQLAKTMVAIGKNAGRNVRALVTDMDVPLGNSVGNAIEIKEAVSILKGEGPGDLRELCVILAANMYSLCFGKDISEAVKAVEKVIENRSAFDILCKMVAAQGGDVQMITDTEKLPINQNRIEVLSPADGYIAATNSELVGVAAMLAGAGRAKKDDIIDHSAGVYLYKKTADAVSKGEPLAVIYADSARVNDAKSCLEKAYTYSDSPVEKRPVVLSVVE